MLYTVDKVCSLDYKYMKAAEFRTVSGEARVSLFYWQHRLESWVFLDSNFLETDNFIPNTDWTIQDQRNK